MLSNFSVFSVKNIKKAAPNGVAFLLVLIHTLLAPFFGCQAELIIPFLPKPADKWFFKKLIDRQMQFLAQHASTMAYIPSVIF